MNDLIAALRSGEAGPATQRRAADRIEELEDALEPFGDVCGEGDEDFPDSLRVTLHFGRTTHYALTLGDLRRARAILSGPLPIENNASPQINRDCNNS
jgi:hypothetical protein